MNRKYLLVTLLLVACSSFDELRTGSFLRAQAQKPGQPANPQSERKPQTEVTVPQLQEEVAEDIALKPGDEAPKFALRTLDGSYELLTKWSGDTLSRPASQPVRHVVVVSFFATWCQPCMKELPHLQKLYHKYQGYEVKFFLVDITEATRTVEGYENSPEASAFLKERGFSVPVLQDTYGMAKKNYGVATLPRLFVIDKFRTIRLVKKGFHEGEDFEGELAGMIDQLLAEGQ